MEQNQETKKNQENKNIQTVGTIEFSDGEEYASSQMDAEKNQLEAGKKQNRGLFREKKPNNQSEYGLKISWKRLGLILLAVVAVCTGSVAAYWGVGQYERNFRKISLEKILPKDVDLVVSFPASPDDQQYQALKSLVEKFPGYQLLVEKLVNDGSYNTAADQSKDIFEKMGLSYDQDIRPIIGKNGYLIFPTLNDLEKQLMTQVSQAANVGNNVAEKFISSNLALNQDKDQGEGRVLGETKDIAVDNPTHSIPTPDFILAFELKDLARAKKTWEKLSAGSDFRITAKNYHSYDYFELIPNVEENSNQSKGYLLNKPRFYQAVLGGNLVLATNEEMLRSMIEVRKSFDETNQLLGKIQPTRIKSSHQVLAENSKYQEAKSNLVKDSESSLISFYYRFSLDEINNCSGGDCGAEKPLIKYPQELIAGAALVLDQNGVMLRTLSNQYALGAVAQSSFTQGLAGKIPENINDRWVNLLLEHSNLRDVYYAFKKNSLTEEGQARWSQLLSGLARSTGINLEQDIVDEITGQSALVMMSGKNLEPYEIILANVRDPREVIRTAGEIVDFAKEMYVSTQLPIEQSAIANCRTEKCSPINTKKQNASMAAVQEILNSKISESDSPVGKIYSYKLPGTPYSFDFGFSGNLLVLGSHYDAVVGLLSELANKTQPALGENKYFNLVASHFSDDGYMRFFASTDGIWNAANYYLSQLTALENMENGSGGSIHDSVDAFGAILRTVRLIGAQQTAKDKSNYGAAYFNIEKIPEDEFKRAEEVLLKISTQ